MTKGTVKWFNETKGYGFVAPENGDKDVFLHISALQEAGVASVAEGQEIEFEIVENRGKQAAGNVKII